MMAAAGSWKSHSGNRGLNCPWPRRSFVPPVLLDGQNAGCVEDGLPGTRSKICA
jgi:hypothetical protein